MPTVTHLYDTEDQVHGVVAALVEAGYKPEQISVVSPRTAAASDDEDSTPVETGAAIGGVAGAGAGLLASAGVFAIPGIGPILGLGALASAIASALVGAGAGAIVGSVAGTFVEWGVDPEDAAMYEEGLKRGSSLVSVDVERGQEPSVHSIMDAFHPVDIEQRRREYEASGWSTQQPKDGPTAAPGS